MFRDFNDNTHGNLNIPSEIFDFIDQAHFQRLDHIKQLATAHHIFIGANHTRKHHSLGVAHLATEYSLKLFMNKKERLTFILACLYHDIGHGPFSHTWDNVVYSKIYGVEKGHDEHRYKILKLYEPLLVKHGIEYQDVIDIWTDKNKVIASILQGPLGVDRMDFIKRDTKMTGTSHFGTIDINRIINNTKIINKTLVYKAKILSDLIQGYGSRIYMYQQVYLHKTVVASAILVELMISLSQHNFVEQTQDLEKFMYLTDESILAKILENDNEDAKFFADCYYKRKLPKLISEKKINEFQHPKSWIYSKTSSYIEIHWISAIINLNIEKEFTEYDIHIQDNQNIIKFEDYIKTIEQRINWINYSADKYQLYRIYHLYL